MQYPEVLIELLRISEETFIRSISLHKKHLQKQKLQFMSVYLKSDSSFNIVLRERKTNFLFIQLHCFLKVSFFELVN